MKNRTKLLIILYLVTLFSKWGLTEDTQASVTNEKSTKNSIDDPKEESVKDSESTFESKDSTTVTEARSKTTVKKQNIDDGDQLNIVGGFTAQLGWYPYQVALFTVGYGAGSFYCGGSIISNYYVLTAGHCAVHKNQIKVIAGIVSNQIFGNTAQVRLSKYIMIHEKYDHESGDSVNDIAMIVLETPFYFNNYVKPIYLATSPPVVGSQCVVSGWGYINPAHTKLQSTLKALFVTVREPRICKRWYQQFMDGMICTGFIKGQDFCFGDSGGPLVCDHMLHGVVSFFLAEAGDFCASGGPNVYTKVYYYRPWIDYHMSAINYRQDNGTSASTKSESNLIRPKLFIISAFILLSIPFK